MEKYEKIKQKKISTSIEEICKGTDEEFGTYLSYCRRLKFDETPNYEYLRKLFRNLFYSKNTQYDYVFDWMLRKENFPSTLVVQKIEEEKQSENDDKNDKINNASGTGSFYQKRDENNEKWKRIEDIE